MELQGFLAALFLQILELDCLGFQSISQGSLHFLVSESGQLCLVFYCFLVLFAQLLDLLLMLSFHLIEESSILLLYGDVK